ncbi:MAG: LysR family transcriptional regulator [Flavobacteriaceae bacterium]
MKYSIKSRIWIEADGKIVLGEGRVQLLKAIAAEGSLSKAAKTIGMSYKKAWSLLDMMNTRSSSPLVVTNVGGKGGGGAQLTPHGESLVRVFETINEQCWKFLDDQLAQNQL